MLFETLNIQMKAKTTDLRKEKLNTHSWWMCVVGCLNTNSKHNEKWHDIVGLKLKCPRCCPQPAATVHFNFSPLCVTQAVQPMLFKECLRVVAS
jgi:hypothetical protein